MPRSHLEQIRKYISSTVCDHDEEEGRCLQQLLPNESGLAFVTETQDYIDTAKFPHESPGQL